MALLGAFALLVFGPDQLPRVARKAGGVMREIQNTSQSFIREMERAADVQDVAEKKPWEPTSYDPTPFEVTAADATGGFDDAPSSPEWGHPASEKIAEPRSALDHDASAYEYGAEPFDPPPPPKRV